MLKNKMTATDHTTTLGRTVIRPACSDGVRFFAALAAAKMAVRCSSLKSLVAAVWSEGPGVVPVI